MDGNNGVGRTASFATGVQEVKQPTVQSIQPIAFHPTSVLHPISYSDNGLGDRDYSRRLMGLKDSTTGQSSDTYDRNTMMRFPFIKTFG